MGELSKAIEETAARADRQVTRQQVERLLHLPNTELMQTNLRNWKPDPLSSHGHNETARLRLEFQVKACEERDRILASRPEGCWCWGTGQPRYKSGNLAFDCNEESIDPTEWCICLESHATKTEWSINQEQKRTDRITRQWSLMEVPARFADFTLDTSPFLIAHPKIKKKVLGAGADDSWFFFGLHGVGKTGLAIGYARWYLERKGGQASILFRSLPKLLSELKGTYNRKRGAEADSEQEVLTRYQSVSLLILDDLGAERTTESGQIWLQDRLYQIIGERHDEMKPMVFTSNLSLSQLNDRLGERLTWRILEMCDKSHIIEVKGPNLRDL